MEEKLLSDFIKNSQSIDLEVCHHQMFKMIFRQSGTNKFLSQTKMSPSQEQHWIHSIGVIAPKTLMASKIHLGIRRADIGELKVDKVKL